MKIYAKFFGRVTRNKRVKDKKSQRMNKYTFIEILSFIIKVLKHVFINYRINKRKKSNVSRKAEDPILNL